jgi:hypothetical protein
MRREVSYCRRQSNFPGPKGNPTLSAANEVSEDEGENNCPEIVCKPVASSYNLKIWLSSPRNNLIFSADKTRVCPKGIVYSTKMSRTKILVNL